MTCALKGKQLEAATVTSREITADTGTIGTGLTGGAGSAIAVDIAGLAADTPVLTDVIAFGDLSGVDVNKATLTVINGILDHDALLNFVADEHVAHTGVVLTAGTGMTGGGDISASRTFDVAAGTGLVANANDIAIDVDGTVTFVSPVVWTFPVGVTAEGLFVTGTAVDANHVINLAQAQSLVTGLQWVEPADTGANSGAGYIGTATVAEINALTPTTGDVVVAEDVGTPSAGTSDLLAVGDTVEFDGTSWLVKVANSGGVPPSGTRSVVATTSTFVTGGGLTTVTDEGKIAEWTSALTPNTLTSPDDGDALLINGDTVTNEHNGYTFAGAVPTGTWIQFTGAGQINAGTGLSKSGNTINAGAGDGIAVAADTIALDLNGLVVAVFDPATDSVPFLDATDSGNKTDAWADVVSASAGNGLSAASGAYALDLNELSAAVVDVAADSIAIIDATDSGSKQESLVDLATGMAGTGLAASSGSFAIDLNELATEATFAIATDFIAIVDATDSGSDKTLWATITVASAGVGLTGTAGSYAVDLNEVSAVVFDPATDTLPIIDATDGSTKKDLWSDIATLVAGTGVTATAGVFSVAAGQTLTIQQITTEVVTGTNTVLAEAAAISDPAKAWVELNGQTGMQDDDTDVVGDAMFGISGTSITWLASTGCAPDLATSDRLFLFMMN